MRYVCLITSTINIDRAIFYYHNFLKTNFSSSSPYIIKPDKNNRFNNRDVDNLYDGIKYHKDPLSHMYNIALYIPETHPMFNMYLLTTKIPFRDRPNIHNILYTNCIKPILENL